MSSIWAISCLMYELKLVYLELCLRKITQKGKPIQYNYATQKCIEGTIRVWQIRIQMYWPGILDEQKGQQNFEIHLQYNDNNSYALLKLCILFATHCTKYFILDHLLKTILSEKIYCTHFTDGKAEVWRNYLIQGYTVSWL